MPGKIITLGMIEAMGADQSNVAAFRRVFGESAELTQQNWDLAGKHHLARICLWRLLPESAQKAFAAKKRALWHEHHPRWNRLMGVDDAQYIREFEEYESRVATMLFALLTEADG
jgi:hypothetical protein